MENCVLKLYTDRPNLLDLLDESMRDDFSNGIKLTELENYSLELFNRSSDLFPQLLFLIKESHLYLEYNGEGHFQAELSGPILTQFLTTKSIAQDETISHELNLHSDAIIFKEKKKTKVANPKTKNNLVFNVGLQSAMSSLHASPFLCSLVQEAQLLTCENISQHNVNSLMDDFIYKRMHSGHEHTYNPTTLQEMIMRQSDHFRRRILKKEELAEYDMVSALIDRSSSRTSSPELTQQSIKLLISLVFSNTAPGKKLYPAAGAIYEIYPLIHIYDESVGLKSGTYEFAGENEELVFLGQNEIPPNTEQRNPKCCISLIADPQLSRFKYGPLSLKLSMLNAGVLLTYFYLFSGALRLNGCAYGQKSTKDALLCKEHKDLAGFCLY